jgi:hypothetical protein
MDSPPPIARSHRFSPMVIAVRFQQHGHWWPSQISGFEQDPDGTWWANCSPTQEHYKAGVRGSWERADDLQIGDHEVDSASGIWMWGPDWARQAWPPGLERFAAARWNERQAQAGKEWHLRQVTSAVRGAAAGR